MQNEAGTYIGFKSSLLDRKLMLTTYVDIFHFFYRRYQVDKDHTWGVGAWGELSYSPANSLNMLIRYSLKDKAKNYAEDKGNKFVLPSVRQRVSYQLRYALNKNILLKTGLQYVRSDIPHREYQNGYMGSGTLQASCGRFPLRMDFMGAWFKTDSYDSRLYQYEPSLLYTFSMPSFYGKGARFAFKAQYEYKKRLMLQAKWGCTRYADRDKIGTGTEEIQGNKKFDLQIQLRVKW